MFLKSPGLITLAVVAALSITACDSDDDDDGATTVTDTETDAGADTDADAGTMVPGTPDNGATPEASAAMSFFVTSQSIGDGGNLGGLAGADAHCANLAAAAGATETEWRAYLSTTGADGVNAIERIGAGPWVNAVGVTVANNPQDLISDGNNLNGLTAITENGDAVPGRGFTPNQHDILTGTELNGLASTDGSLDTTCSNWTSNGDGAALVGHHDRSGPLIDFVVNPNSWSTAHPTMGCGQADLQATGGDGLLYCFVEN